MFLVSIRKEFQCTKICVLWISCAKVIRVRIFIDRLLKTIKGA